MYSHTILKRKAQLYLCFEQSLVTNVFVYLCMSIFAYLYICVFVYLCILSGLIWI